MYGSTSPQPGAYTHHPKFHNPPAYAAAKAGVIQFTRYAACHLATRGIRVNRVSPGPFPTERVQRADGFIDELERRIPLGRTSWHRLRTADPRRLALGTVQWGMPYGLANRSGPPPGDELGAILRRARSAGIRTLDTAGT